MATYRFAVRKFKKAAEGWLSDEDFPAIVQLENLAKAIDAGDDAPARIAQFGLAYRSLLKRKPAVESGADELEEALAEADA